MEELELFIEQITINEVRHLKDVAISISDTERKHLILTGKNGSGKTSVLEAIKITFERTIKNVKHNVEKSNDVTFVYKQEDKVGLTISFNDRHYYRLLKSIFVTGNFIIASFQARRNSKLNIPQGIKKFNFKKNYNLDDSIAPNFLQHIVNLKADRSFAKDDNDSQVVEEVDRWFNNFEKVLKPIFDDKKLKLVFDRKDYNFNIVLKNGQKMPFNALSDGYSAILNIVMELMLRMEGKVKNVYDIQGIVLIDEIETHLHIDLQNKILPFLTSFFPKIQFIVSTHSPFVLNSISNAVIYDLEKNIRIEDMSDYPADGIVKGYFDSDEYSQAGIKKIREYEKLALNEELNEQQQERFDELHMEFRDISGKLAPQLKSEFYRIELERKTRVHAKANG
ncbi:MAG: AAA family ATPase [Saprospiraceae bacterium]